MARISKLAKSEVGSDVREVYDRMGQQRGNVPNLYRIFAHRPEMMKTLAAHLSAVTNGGTVPVRTKELVATLVSRINQCHY